jgi:flagellar export protein FliJ
MRPFRFTLEALLTVRRRAEQVAMERYAAALAVRQKARAAWVEAEAAIQQAGQAWKERFRSASLAGDLAGNQAHLAHLGGQRDGAAGQLQEAELRLAPEWRDMLAARQARETVEKFRARQREHYDREFARSEARELDALAQRRFSPVTSGPSSEDFS